MNNHNRIHRICSSSFGRRILRSINPKNLCFGSFVRNVAVLSGGTALSQAVSVLSLPFLTRLYSPEAFGSYAVYTSLISILAALSSLQYEQAIVLPKEEADAYNLLLLSLGIVLGITGLISLIIMIFQQSIVGLLLKETNITPWLRLVPVSLLAIGVFQTFSFWLIRNKLFKRIAFLRLVQTVTTVGSQLGAAIFFTTKDSGLISGFVVGQIVTVLLLAGFIWRNDRLSIRRYADINRIKRQAALYKKYPLFSSWMFVLDRFQTSMPVLFLSRFFGPEIAGYYSMTIRILYLPSNLVGGAISRVFFQRVAEEKNREGSINLLVEKVFRWLCLFGILYFIGVFCTSYLFRFILGSKWEIVGYYSRILSISFALMLAVSTISIILGALNRQELEAIWQFTSIVLTAIFLTISIAFRLPHITLYLLTINNLIVYSFYAFLIFRASGAKFSCVLAFWRNA